MEEVVTLIFFKTHLSAQAGRRLHIEQVQQRVSAQCPALPTAPWWQPTPAPHSATTTEPH